jgi:hypothetical protein
MTDPNISEPQFMVLGSTGVAMGKKLQTNSMKRKQRAPILMAIPYRPSVHFRGGSGSPRRRLDKTQPIQSVYEVRRLPPLRVNSAFRAAVDPILMSESRTVTTTEIMTALRGIFQPGVTYKD